MTREEIEARLEELREVEEEYAALLFEQDLAYLISEGFITEEDGRLYPVEDSWTTDELLESV